MKKTYLTVSLLASFLLAGVASASTTTIFNPGDSRDYLTNWCGGQSLNEYAEGFTASSTVSTIVRVTTTCSIGGRGTKTRTYVACWRDTFTQGGTLLTKSLINSGSWLQGSTPVACAATYNPSDVFLLKDATGTTMGTLGSMMTSAGYRAYLTLN